MNNKKTVVWKIAVLVTVLMNCLVNDVLAENNKDLGTSNESISEVSQPHDPATLKYDKQSKNESESGITESVTPGSHNENLSQEGDNLEAQANEIIQRVRQQKQAKEEQAIQEQNRLEPGDIQVNHVPEFIKEDIKQQLRSELREDVLNDVLDTAKTQRWGIPDAQPKWFSRIKLKGDLRLRGESILFADDNDKQNAYINFNSVNKSGGIAKTDLDKLYYNTWQDRHRMRVRARAGLDAKLTSTLKASMRISTGNTTNPVSTNQTLGQYGNRYQVVWDRLYLQYTGPLSADRPWVKLFGGRMPNPFFTTDLIWDKDLSFEGLAAKFDFKLGSNDDLLAMTENNTTLFYTLGVFPLTELELSAKDKWLLGTQLGTSWVFNNQSSFRVGLAYYHFVNTTGELNALDNNELDYTAPAYLQKGNLMFDIRNSSDVSSDENLYALASEYHEVALTFAYDISNLAPIHVIITGEVVKNIGFDENDIRERTNNSSQVTRSGGIAPDEEFKENTMAYHARLSIGWPQVTFPGNWRFSLEYKRLEADAAMDAFTDSDFHLGGTDAKGWSVKYEHGLSENAWLTAKYSSASEIESAAFRVEVIQLDINAKF